MRFRTRLVATHNRDTGNPRGKLNDIVHNDTGENLLFDLWDGNPDCDQNRWKHNEFETANQGCIR